MVSPPGPQNPDPEAAAAAAGARAASGGGHPSLGQMEKSLNGRDGNAYPSLFQRHHACQTSKRETDRASSRP